MYGVSLTRAFLMPLSASGGVGCFGSLPKSERDHGLGGDFSGPFVIMANSEKDLIEGSFTGGPIGGFGLANMSSTDAGRTDAGRTERSGTGAGRTDAGRTERSGTGAGRTDAGRTERSGTGAGRTERSGTGAGRTERSGTGAGRTDAGRTGEGRTDTGRTDAGRTGEGRTDAGASVMCSPMAVVTLARTAPISATSFMAQTMSV
jgi:hypothetical protein